MLLKMRRFAAGIASGWVVLALIFGASVQLLAQDSTSAKGEAGVMHQATGSLEVKMAPQKPNRIEGGSHFYELEYTLSPAQ